MSICLTLTEMRSLRYMIKKVTEEIGSVPSGGGAAAPAAVAAGGTAPVAATPRRLRSRKRRRMTVWVSDS